MNPPTSILAAPARRRRCTAARVPALALTLTLALLASPAASLANLWDLPGSKDRKRNKDLETVAAVLGTVALLDSVLNQVDKDPELRKQLDTMPAEPAWAHVRERMKSQQSGQPTPARSKNPLARIPGLPTAQPTRQQQQANQLAAKEEKDELQAIEERAKNNINSAMPISAFNDLCDQMAAQLAEQLEQATKDRQPKEGDRFTLVIGSFKYYPRPGAQPDRKLEIALQRVIDRLGANEQIRERFTLVTYPVEDANELIRRVGGGSDQWIREDGRNYRDATVQDYHPDDIYLVTGDLIEELKDGYILNYDVACRLLHPRSRGQVAVDTPSFQTRYLYHPTRDWLTHADNEAIGKRS